MPAEIYQENAAEWAVRMVCAALLILWLIPQVTVTLPLLLPELVKWRKGEQA